jgi:glutathione S-transferase
MYSRSVWLTLLEKNLDFELVSLKLNGDQWRPEFLEINPFNHVPVLVDNGFRVFESLAILDYIEAKYPTPTLLPTEVKALALVRMVEMVTMNELVPASLTLIRETRDLQKIQQANRTVTVTLTFLEENLRNSPYLGSQTLTFADIVAGAFVPLLPYLNISLAPYPNLATWFERLMQRESWKIIQPNPEVMEDWIRRVRVLPRVRQRQYR